MFQTDVIGRARQHAVYVMGFVFAAAMLLGAPASWAQDYPNRAVKIIVPFPAGGTADAVPRLVAEWLSRKWGQPVVIENPTGAAGNIGTDQAYRAEPDGYTLLSAPPPPLVINLNLYPNLPFDPMKFEPIAILAQVPNGVIVNPSKGRRKDPAGIHRVSESQSRQGDIGHAGNGTTSHLYVRDAATAWGRCRFSTFPIAELRRPCRICSPAMSISCAIISAFRCRWWTAANCACWPWRRPNAWRRCPICRRSRKHCRGFEIRCLVRGGCAAEDAKGDHRKDQRRHQRGAA